MKTLYKEIRRSMRKKKYPILEFDSNKIAFIEPGLIPKVPVPERLVICFFKEAIQKLKDQNQITPIHCLKSEGNDIIIYKFNDLHCCLVQGILGAAGSGGFLEEFIALGINKIMFCGGAGVLNKDVTFGRFVVIGSAVRDEGLSYHYLPPSREVEADTEVVKVISDYLCENKIDYLVGKTWTTDAFYRETVDKIKLRKKEGCVIVEMEQSALIAVSLFRGVRYGAIIYGGDDLTKEVYDSRHWQSRADIRFGLMEICRDIVLKL